jgi:hypothetical protein
MQQETAPNLAMWFGILSHADGDIQFLLVRLRAVQGFPSKWRTAKIEQPQESESVTVQ